MSSEALSTAEIARTVRQQILPEFGERGQQKLASAHVAIVGAGGLGSPVIEYLAAAGVGRLTVIDDDVIEVSNLHRQTLHDHARIGQAKTASAVLVAKRLAPECEVTEIKERLTAENAAELLRGADLIVDGSDSFDTRFEVNTAARELGLPVVWGAVLRWDAQVTVFWPTPPIDSGIPAVDLTDAFADTLATRQTVSCATAGVMGAVCGQAGATMALEAIKILSGIGTTLLGHMLVFDGLGAEVRKVPLVPKDILPQIEIAALSSIPESAVIVDVRTVSEREKIAGPAGSIHLPLDALINNEADLLSKLLSQSDPLVVVCAEGPRSARAARHLAAAGYNVVGFLDGGLS